MEDVFISRCDKQQKTAEHLQVLRHDLSRLITRFGVFFWCLCMFTANQYEAMASRITHMELYDSSLIPSPASIAIFYLCISVFALAGILMCTYGIGLGDLQKKTWNPFLLHPPYRISAAFCVVCGTVLTMLLFARKAAETIKQGLEIYSEPAEAYILPAWFTTVIYVVAAVFIAAFLICVVLVLLHIKRTQTKTDKLTDRLKLFCTGAHKNAVKPAEPSYMAGRFRKGTWLQIFGWIWLIGGLIPFSLLADTCFPSPPIYALTGDGVDTFTAPIRVSMTFCSCILQTVLHLIGWLFIYYGFTLNRKPHATGRLYFKQFSLCQILLLISHVGFSLSFPLFMENTNYHLSNYCSSVLLSLSTVMVPASVILFFVAAGIWAFRNVPRLYHSLKSKKNRTE